jgi:hypothetical protein
MKLIAVKVLPLPGSHLDQGLGLVGGQALFEILDGGDLRRPELEAGAARAPVGHQLRHVAHAMQKGAGLVVGGRLAGSRRKVRQPFSQKLGAEEREHTPGTRLRVQPIGEMGLDARGLE